MRSMVLSMSRREAERRIRAKKRQIMMRQAVRLCVRFGILCLAALGVFILAVARMTMGTAGVFTALAMLPMMWGMEDVE